MVMSSDVLEFLVTHSKFIHRCKYDDVSVSKFVLIHYRPLIVIPFKMLGFVTVGIEGHNCTIRDDDIMFFRFKTDDREFDIRLARELVESEFDLSLVGNIIKDMKPCKWTHRYEGITYEEDD